MKLNDRSSCKPPQCSLHHFVVISVIALCLISAGAAIIFRKSAIVGGPGRFGDHSREGELRPAHALHEPPQSTTQQPELTELAGSAGRQVYLDPLTGKIGVPPPGVTNLARLMSLEEEKALSTSSEGLEQIPLTGPAGGVKVDLQGRFRSQVVVAIDSLSNISVRCVTGTAGPEGLAMQKAASTTPEARLNQGTPPKE